MPNYPLFAAAACALASAPVARATLLASDDFAVPGYTVGSLVGQPVRGTGFAGSWAQVPGLTSALDVTADGKVGRPFNNGLNAGVYARFATALLVPATGQFFFSYTSSNPTTTTLRSTRLDLNLDAAPVPARRVLLGGFDPDGNLALLTESDVGGGSPAGVYSPVSSLGTHRLVGVIDARNNALAIFVDPTPDDFYARSGAHHGASTTPWAAPAGLTFASYSFIDNLDDHPTQDDVIFSTDPRSVGLALPGDANRNGVIDPDDFALTDRGYAQHFSGWSNGDFNGDGVIDASDFALIDESLATQSGALSPAFLAQRQSQFGPDYVSALTTAIPEPAAVATSVLLPLFRSRRPRRAS